MATYLHPNHAIHACIRICMYHHLMLYGSRNMYIDNKHDHKRVPQRTFYTSETV
ncbi:uncharacterized protein BX663DRAFT_495605 [Cokeromyces recurvatus]|uniref:uncharacterized protein n=1 Tax=Cokeromyces recurvatus TaxID=90255 RepID=UPI00221E5BD2|nr:uncharacterized protein BX663DRAFT_495605 [Cokeromyces recurvatus]KAI7907345.1 hypothetical protein BX663DRAFT_495605 [Cokeromyces recurvatus]